MMRAFNGACGPRHTANVLVVLGVLFSGACGDETARAVPEVPEQPEKQGAELIVTVAGRGVVSSDPVALFCGNDGGQVSCRNLFELDPKKGSTHVTLTAAAAPDWFFAGWELVSEAPGAEFAALPDEPDLTLPELYVTVAEPAAGAPSARLLYSVVARFSPTPLEGEPEAH